MRDFPACPAPRGNLRVATISHLGNLDSAWDSLTGPGDLFLTRSWLKVVDNVTATPKWYISAHDETGLAGATTAVIGTVESPWVLGRPDTVLQASARDGRPGAAELAAEWLDPSTAILPTAVLGGRHMGHSRVLLAERIRDQSDDAARIMDQILAAAEAEARERGCRSASLPFVDVSDHLLSTVLASRGYRSHESGRYYYLDLPHEGFDAYLSRFGSHRRQRIRADRRRIADAGVAVRHAPLAEFDIDHLAALETQLLRKYGHIWDPARSRHGLSQMLEVFGDAAVVDCAIQKNQVVGFGASVSWRGELFPRHAGFDYGRQGNLPLYFETLYYALVDRAARSGLYRANYGMGSEEAKASRGCASEVQMSWTKLLGADG